MKRAVKRLSVICVLLACTLLVLVAVALHLGTRHLKTRVEQALGPRGAVGALKVGWASIELRDVRLPAPPGWPVKDALHAQRIVVEPDLFGLLSARPRIARVTAAHVYLAVVRERDGRLRMLPGLLDSAPNAKPEAIPAFGIGTVELRHGKLDFFDAAARTPAAHIRLYHLHARVDELAFPGLGGRSTLQIDGLVKGAQHSGRLSVTGWVELAQHNAEIATRLQGVDLAALQPYLVRAGETGVRSGTLDLTMKSMVRAGRLRAPGSAVLTGLELAPEDTAGATFMAMPSAAVIAALNRGKHRIAVDFLLEGKLDNPRFSLNAGFTRQLGAAVAQALGIDVAGTVPNTGPAALGTVVKKLLGK